MMNARILLTAVAALAAAALARAASFSPAATVTHANLQTLANAAASLAGGTADPLLARQVPSAILNNRMSRLFGPMRPGAPGVSVCYVDAAAIARTLALPVATAAQRAQRDAALERAKYWATLYPCTVGKAALLAKRPQLRESHGALVIPPVSSGEVPLYAVYDRAEKWVGVSVASALAKNALVAGARAAQHPLGADLAFIRMDAAGARAIFGSDSCAGGTVSIRLAPAGLEVSGTVRLKNPENLPPLAPGSFAFSGVPATAPLFGATTAASDIRSADVFGICGPEVAAYVRKSLARQPPQPGGACGYYLPYQARPGQKGKPPATALPRVRFQKILPEALARRDVENAMFCSPTAVLKQSLPRIAASLPMTEAVKLEAGIRLIRAARGDGLGFMSWREGPNERFFFRVSRDELRGTAPLWSAIFL